MKQRRTQEEKAAFLVKVLLFLLMSIPVIITSTTYLQEHVTPTRPTSSLAEFQASFILFIFSKLYEAFHAQEDMKGSRLLVHRPKQLVNVTPMLLEQWRTCKNAFQRG